MTWLDPRLLALGAPVLERQAQALAYVRGLRSARAGERTPPALEYRCAARCLLLAVYPSADGLVLYAPKLRRDDELAGRLDFHHLRGADLLDDATTTDDPHAWRTGERAWLLDAEGWATGCHHHPSIHIAADRIRADLATRRPPGAIIVP